MDDEADGAPPIRYRERDAPKYSPDRPAALLRSRKFRRTRVSTYTTPYFTCRNCNAIITVDIVRGGRCEAGWPLSRPTADRYAAPRAPRRLCRRPC